jgi:hypothetical protein
VPDTLFANEGVCKYALPGSEIDAGGNFAVLELTGLPAPIDMTFLTGDQSMKAVLPERPVDRK